MQQLKMHTSGEDCRYYQIPSYGEESWHVGRRWTDAKLLVMSTLASAICLVLLPHVLLESLRRASIGSKSDQGEWQSTANLATVANKEELEHDASARAVSHVVPQIAGSPRLILEALSLCENQATALEGDARQGLASDAAAVGQESVPVEDDVGSNVAMLANGTTQREQTLEARKRVISAFLAGGGDKRCELPRLDGRNATWEQLQDAIAKAVRKGLSPSVVATHMPEGIADPRGLQGQHGLDRAEVWRQALLASQGKLRVHADTGRTMDFDGVDNDHHLITLSDFLTNNVSGMSLFMAYFMGHFAQRALYTEMPEIPPLFANVDKRKQIALGLSNSAIHFHEHQETWLLQLAGRKAWWLASPKGPPFQTLPGRVADPCLALDPDLTSIPEGADLCVVHPGEALFFLDGTHHATCNLDNFVLGYGAQGSTDSWPPLHRAAFRGDTEVVRTLIRDGCEVNEKDNEGAPALYRAVTAGNIPIVKLLLQAGASWESVELWHRAGALTLAATLDNPELLQCLVDVGAPIMTDVDETVHLAASSDNKQELEDLLEWIRHKCFEGVGEGAE